MSLTWWQPLAVLGTAWLLWVFFLAAMALERWAENTLAPGQHRDVMVLGYSVLIVALLIDLAINITLATLVFLDLPGEVTVSQRLKRYIKKGDGWRYQAACWFCQRYLDPFDPDGSHCSR